MQHDELVALPVGTRAPGAARAEVRRRLSAWRLDDLVDTVVLLTSELVTNVLVHTSSQPSLRIGLADGGVVVSVGDDSPVGPTRRHHSSVATTGRGVRLLDDLADDWGCEAVPDGKVVWFRVSGGHDPWAPFRTQGRGPEEDA